MSRSDINVRLVTATQEMAAAIERVQVEIALRFLPAIEAVGVAVREWYASLPGMPYTGPSLWDADQMIGDRGNSR